MAFLRRAFKCMAVTAGLLLMVSCGSSGEGSTSPSSSNAASPPYIRASVLSFNAGSYQGNIPNVSVLVQNPSTGTDITTAIVTVNEISLVYNPDSGHKAYEGTISVPPGNSIVLSVTVGGKPYSISSTQFTSYPTIAAPGTDTWYAHLANTVRWTGGTPATNAVYNLAVLDAHDPYGVVVWPTTTNGNFQVIPTSTSSYNFLANNLSAGNRLLLAAIVKGEPIPEAASGSKLLVAGCSTIPITIVDATLKSITVTPANPIISWGLKQQFTATATFSDNSSLDVTGQVNWMANNVAVSMDYSTPGLASASSYGLSTVTAYLNSVSGSTSVTVLPPNLLSIQVTPSNRTIVPGTIQHFSASGRYEDGNVRDITSSVTWSSSNVDVATINSDSGSNGQAAAIAAGTTTVSATLQGISQSTALTIANRPSFTGNYVYLQSDTGDYIGGGISTSFTQADAQFYTTVTGGHLALTVTGSQTQSDGDFMLPNTLSEFQTGYFGNLTRYPFNNAAVGGLDWSKDHRGCNILSGWFTVDNVTYSSGKLSAIDLHFVQHCENLSPALYGWLHLEP